ncbi:MAG: glycosyltransferase family 4 protein [Lentimicrobiaceae bacterium]|jgi:glycosyltransferase involved in cell wall biosynthesis|nr:glycosyltransferase family 4 protein [Lentimicrobiaceae bacterium]MDD4598049.1 glycosyltransferase family 4 protein [Lentimicrobiaceae bacterium]
MLISVFNGAGQVDYLFGLISGLAEHSKKPVHVLDSDAAAPLLQQMDNVIFHQVYSFKESKASTWRKLKNIIRFYRLQLGYLIKSKPGIVHFQWLNRQLFADRIIIPLVARLFGHKMVLTVHNINTASRDEHDSIINRISLRILYHLCHHLIVHTPGSRDELIEHFSIDPAKIDVIRHGTNNKVQITRLTSPEARNILNLSANSRVVLFFGNIDHYKGLDIILDSLKQLPADFCQNLTLIIAGQAKSKEYDEFIKKKISDVSDSVHVNIIQKLTFIPDEDIEIYFKAADCIVLPYRKIYQSGIIFMAYAFGLPILASDTGNFRNDIPENKCGYIVKENTSKVWAESLLSYFDSSLFSQLKSNRIEIKKWADDYYSWEQIGSETLSVYSNLKKKSQSGLKATLKLF